jgi:hypothetical protein
VSRATTERLGELHGVLAENLIARVKSGQATAAELNVARQLLKDNHIDADPKPGSSLGKLADAVQKYPFQPGEEDGYGPN